MHKKNEDKYTALKQLFSSLEKAKANLNPEDQKKLEDVISLIKQMKDEGKLLKMNAFQVVNWVSAKVLEIMSLIPDIMQDKNKSFKEFCNSLQTTNINLHAKSRALLLFGIKSPGKSGKTKREPVHESEKETKNFRRRS